MTKSTTKTSLREGEGGVEAINPRTASTLESHAQHDPTPWTVEHTNDLCPELPYVMAIGEHGGPIDVCVVYGTDRNADANAAFIVRAVNTHATLLAALKSAREEIALRGSRSVLGPIDAAIADAERA